MNGDHVISYRILWEFNQGSGWVGTKSWTCLMCTRSNEYNQLLHHIYLLIPLISVEPESCLMLKRQAVSCVFRYTDMYQIEISFIRSRVKTEPPISTWDHLRILKNRCKNIVWYIHSQEVKYLDVSQSAAAIVLSCYTWHELNASFLLPSQSSTT